MRTGFNSTKNDDLLTVNIEEDAVHMQILTEVRYEYIKISDADVSKLADLLKEYLVNKLLGIKDE